MVINGITFEITLTTWLALAGVGFALIFYVTRYFNLFKTLKAFADPQHWPRLFTGINQNRERFKLGLIIAALAALSIAVLQPKWGKKPQLIVQESRNILFVLDVSRSMLAQDLAPNRLAFMRLKLRNILERLGPERVGLILFADKAFLHCPLTSDFNAFFSFLDQANHEVISAGSTAISQALQCAIKTFKSLPTKDQNKIVFLITDGEDFSPNLDLIIEQAKQNDLTVFTIGAATAQGGPVPILDQHNRCIGHEKNRSGEVVISKLNEQFLQELANKLNGEYLRTTSSNQDIELIVEKIASFEKQKMASRTANLLIERQNIFSGLFLALMLIEWFL